MSSYNTEMTDISSSDCKANMFDTECGFHKTDNIPAGIHIIPGSGHLFEYPSNVGTNNIEEGLVEAIRCHKACPKSYAPTVVCIRDCCEFANVAHINFINGDLIIGDPSTNQMCQNLANAYYGKNDALDIFPNLLGINGSIYIVGTQYRKITGFAKLKFVTGSIVIVNNTNLTHIPTFPSLIDVVSKVSFGTNCCDDNPVPVSCDRAAIIIANNQLLRKIVGFEAVRQVKDGIFISDNTCLVNICGFIHLYRTDRIVIQGNDRLSKIIGFCYIDTINFGLYILDNNKFGESDLIISAFMALETTGNVVIIDNRF